MNAEKKYLPKWKKKLTAAERKHLSETTDSSTLAQFKQNFEAQQTRTTMACWDCRSIARKVGLTVDAST